MSDLATLKQAVRDAIKLANADGTYSDQAIDKVHAAINELLPHTPVPRPIDDQEKVAGPWSQLFAQFGPKHTAGKAVRHESTFATLSFKSLPDKPVRMLDIEQEIHARSKDYNNVHMIETIDGSVQGQYIIFGQYHLDADEPQRYKVEFSRAEIRIPGMSDAEVRNVFGFDADQPLAVEFKPPKLHSDVVYCDDDMRINFGSMGGVYVLERANHAGHSVSFP